METPHLRKTAMLLLLVPITVICGGMSLDLRHLAERLVLFAELNGPFGIGSDEDLTEKICPEIGNAALKEIYQALLNDSGATYLETDGYEILSIQRHGLFLVTTELRILRRKSDLSCRALLFSKSL